MAKDKNPQSSAHDAEFSWADFLSLKNRIAFAAGKQTIRLVSNSMAPVLPTGAVAEIERCEYDAVQPYDLIVFWMNGRLICHTVLAKGSFPAANGERTLITRGLGSSNYDEPVRESFLLGRVTSHKITALQYFYFSKLLPVLASGKALALLLAVAFAVRLYGVSDHSFSVDESSSLLFSAWPEWKALFWDNHPPLYHILLRFWLMVFPMTELATRALSAFVSTIGIYFIFQLGILTGSVRRAWLLGLFLTFSTLSIRYAQEVRMYALLECFAVIHLYLLVKFLDQRTRTAAWKFGASCFGLATTHVLGLLPIGWGLFHIFRVLPSRRQQIVAAAGVFTVLFSLMIVFVVRPEFLQWQRIIRAAFGSYYTPIDVFRAIAQNDAFVIAATLAMIPFSFLHADERMRQLARSMLYCWVPLFVLGLLLTHFDQRNVFIPRYFIFLNPQVFLLVVLGYEKVVEVAPSLVLRLGLAVIPLGFISLFPNAYNYTKPAWREVAEVAKKNQVAGVYSTRVKGMMMPYYFTAGIPYTQFTYDENAYGIFKKELAKGRPIMIFDDAYSKISYLPFLVLDLQRERIPFESFEFTSLGSEPIFALVLYPRR